MTNDPTAAAVPPAPEPGPEPGPGEPQVVNKEERAMAETKRRVGGVAQPDGSLKCGDCGCTATAWFQAKPLRKGEAKDLPSGAMETKRTPPPVDDDCHCHATWRHVNKVPAVTADAR